MSRDVARIGAAALELYERCLEEDPHYAPAWAGAGRMHRMIAKYVEGESYDRQLRAEERLKRALELNPDLSSAGERARASRGRSRARRRVDGAAAAAGEGPRRRIRISTPALPTPAGIAV